MCLAAGPCHSGLCTLHLQLPGGTRRPGGVFAAQIQRKDHSLPPQGHALPSFSAFLLTHPRQDGSHPTWASWQCCGARVPSPPKLPSHQQEFMPWVQGCLACTIWPRAKHLITRPPSWGFSGWHHHALAFTIEPGECHPGLRITTPLGSCSVCRSPPGSAQALSPGPEPLLPPPCPGAPHLCSLHLDHFPHSCCCYHCNSLVDSKATFTQ